MAFVSRNFCILILLSVLFKTTDTCLATATTPAPIVCPCATSDVDLLYMVDGTPGDPSDQIQPVATPTLDDNGCPTMLLVTCTPTTGTTVMMQFQDQIGGAIMATSLDLTCLDGNWVYTEGTSGDLLVVSVQCQSQ